MHEKRYYWLKLEENYFDLKISRALRKLPSGAEMLICYLKMQLKYLNTNGLVEHNGIYETLEEEIALDIDEDLTIVQMTMKILKTWGVIETIDNNSIYMVEMQDRIGSKTDSALRVQKFREKQKMLQCNNNVTKCNPIKEIDIEKDIEKDNNIYIVEKNNFEEEFEELWKAYPNKQGKKNALAKFIKARKSGTTYEEIVEGLKKYLLYCHQNKDWYKPKNAETWFNKQSWNDELDIKTNDTKSLASLGMLDFSKFE